MSKWDKAVETIKKLAAQHDEANAKMRELYQSILYHKELDLAGVNKEDVLDQIIGGGLHWPPGGPVDKHTASHFFTDWIFGVRVKGVPDERGHGPVVWFENPIPPKSKMTWPDLETPAMRKERLAKKRGFERSGPSEFGS